MKKNFRWLLIALIAIAALALSYFRTFELYELQTYDWRCQIRGPRLTSNDIALVDIWDDSVQHLGVWPFDREYHAELITALKEAGAKAIVFDILFAEPHEHDSLVAQAAKEAGNVYFSFNFSHIKSKKERFYATKIDSDLIKPYAQAAKGIGFVNTKADMDGKRRRSIPLISYQGKDYYQLSFLVAKDILGISPEEVIKRVPLDEEGCFIVNYAGTWVQAYKHYSYFDILVSHAKKQMGQRGTLNLNELKGKICFIGLTSTGSQDTNPIPIESVYPMVGQYANILNSFLKQDFIYRAGRIPNLLILTLLIAWALWVSFKFKPFIAFRIVLLTMAFFMALAVFLFCRWGWWIDLFYPFGLTVFLYSSATVVRIVSEIKKRELMENELKIASQIQRSFLPEKLPVQKGLELAVYMKPAKAVGGDLYTFLSLSADKTGVMVGDVSGKGTPAALFMAKVVSEFKFWARDKTDPAGILTALNDSLSSESTGGLFVTLTYVIFDRESQQLVFSNGGHLPILAISPEGAGEELVGESGMPLGVMGGGAYLNVQRNLREGEVFALYSDGVSEARNRKKEEYDIPALKKVILENRQESAQEILNKSVADLERFMGKADQHDDITLIIVKVKTEVSL